MNIENPTDSKVKDNFETDVARALRDNGRKENVTDWWETLKKIINSTETSTDM